MWILNTMTGEQQQIPAFVNHGNTYIEQVSYDHDSFLYRLVKKDVDNSNTNFVNSSPHKNVSFTRYLNQPCEYKLSKKCTTLGHGSFSD